MKLNLVITFISHKLCRCVKVHSSIFSGEKLHLMFIYLAGSSTLTTRKWGAT